MGHMTPKKKKISINHDGCATIYNTTTLEVKEKREITNRSSTTGIVSNENEKDTRRTRISQL
jgi:hypothetical protein